MYLGINLSHDSSAALLDREGNILGAVSEERFTRKKHHMTFPRESIKYLMKDIDFEIKKVIIGSISKFEVADMLNLHWIFAPVEASKFDGQWDKHIYPPGYTPTPIYNSRNDPNGIKRKKWLTDRLQFELNLLGINALVFFQDHHDGHLFSAFAGFNIDNGLAVSLDGYGDGDSGAVQEFKIDSKGNYQTNTLMRFSDQASMGYFYSAITHRYNFKPNSHEGKITGLAAYGSASEALVFLRNNVKVKNGNIQFNIPKSKITKTLFRLIQKSTGSDRFISSFLAMADLAAKKEGNYADLAFAAQKVLEESVLEIVTHFSRLSGKSNIFLAGGVFANVRVNQLIAEQPDIQTVAVFPSMGDGGLAVGGVWNYISKEEGLKVKERFSNMYLGNEIGILTSEIENDQELNIRKTSLEDNIEIVSEYLVNSKVVGSIMGRMEFGPRALLNRSIYANPKDNSINTILNNRLRRTEFMPFAPVVLYEDAPDVFDLVSHSSLIAFKYMTMTCRVFEKWRTKIPAVVHIDGTARPQIIDYFDHEYGHKLLQRFKAKTGLPCLINTSFNIHEEPIVSNLTDAVKALKAGSVDLVTTGELIISLNKKIETRNTGGI